MKAIDILLESPFGPDVQRDSGLIVPKSVQDQIDAETAKVREREVAIKAQEQEAAEKRARREAKAKEYFRQQADTDANRAREQAEAEKNARRAQRDKKKFDLLRKQARVRTTTLSILFGANLESTMSKEDFRKWISANRQHYKQYVKPFQTVKRFQGLIRFFSLLGISWMQFEEIWQEYNAVKQLYHENPPQITQEKHDYMMEVLDYKMIKIAIPYAVAAIVKVILSPKATVQKTINVLKQIRNIMVAGTAATAPTGVTQVGWIPILIETIVIFGVEWLITSDWVEPALERYFSAWIGQYLLGYSEEDIKRIENSLIAQVEEEKRQMLAAEVGNGQSEKSDQERFLELMKKADPSFQLN
jgi:hypothetical protein